MLLNACVFTAHHRPDNQHFCFTLPKYFVIKIKNQWYCHSVFWRGWWWEGKYIFFKRKNSQKVISFDRFTALLCSELTKCQKNWSVISVKIQKYQILNIIMIKFDVFFFHDTQRYWSRYEFQKYHARRCESRTIICRTHSSIDQYLFVSCSSHPILYHNGPFSWYPSITHVCRE